MLIRHFNELILAKSIIKQMFYVSLNFARTAVHFMIQHIVKEG